MTLVTRLPLVAVRAGLSDPLLVAASGRGVARWGVSIAGAYRAAALRWPNRVAVIDDVGNMTLAEFDGWTDAIAGALSTRHPSARTLGLLARNHRGFVGAVVAAAKAGLDVVYLNTGFAPPQLRAVVEREAVDVLVHDTEFAAHCDGLATARVSADGSAAESLDGLAGLAQPAPRRPRTPSLPVLLTSGTTGTPKGARRGRPMLDTRATVGFLDRVPYRTSDVFVVPAPLFHAWGFSQLTLAAALGGTLVLRHHFRPAQVLADARTHRATVLAAVPAMLQRILLETEPGPLDPDTLRIVAVSGSALPGDLALDWMDRFGDTLYNLYGSTEVGQATVATPLDLRAAPGCAGRPLPGAEVAVLDRDGTPAPPGRVGRVYVGSPYRFSGYTGGGTKDEIAGLLDTGDLGRFDAEGRLHLAGRADDMVVSGGENVYPQEVEDLLARHPSVAEVAVVGVDDPEWGQRLRAVVVLRPGAHLDGAAVKDHVRRHLARHKVPRDVVFRDQLPKNAAGKVLRRELSKG